MGGLCKKKEWRLVLENKKKKKKGYLEYSLAHSIPSYKQLEDMNKLRQQMGMPLLTVEEFRASKRTTKPGSRS